MITTTSFDIGQIEKQGIPCGRRRINDANEHEKSKGITRCVDSTARGHRFGISVLLCLHKVCFVTFVCFGGAVGRHVIDTGLFAHWTENSIPEQCGCQACDCLYL